MGGPFSWQAGIFTGKSYPGGGGGGGGGGFTLPRYQCYRPHPNNESLH